MACPSFIIGRHEFHGIEVTELVKPLAYCLPVKVGECFLQLARSPYFVVEIRLKYSADKLLTHKYFARECNGSVVEKWFADTN
jgi:hypothetical protein